MSKPWQRKRDYKRILDTRNIRERILVYCEGQKTEPNYFRKFPVKIDIVEVNFGGGGSNTVALVSDAINYADKALNKGKPYNQVWCVFDRDDFPSAQFNQAINKAQVNNIRVAYSNPCFELWYYLHFHYIQSAIDRKKYCRKLSTCMSKKYKKNDSNIYQRLNTKQQIAINNAKKLRHSYVPCNPEKDNPSTTVYLLVEALNKFL
jgi:hypothetical protein